MPLRDFMPVISARVAAARHSAFVACLVASLHFLLAAPAGAASDEPGATSRDLLALRAAATAIVPTTRIELSATDNPALVSGFSFLETDKRGRPFVWAMQPAAELRFFSGPPRDIRVAIHARLATPASAPLRVAVNGLEVADIKLRPAWRTFSFEIPASVLHAGENSLRLGLEGMDGIEVSGRAGPLAMAIREVRFAPAPTESERGEPARPEDTQHEPARSGDARSEDLPTHRRHAADARGSNDAAVLLSPETGLSWPLQASEGSTLHLSVRCTEDGITAGETGHLDVQSIPDPSAPATRRRAPIDCSAAAATEVTFAIPAGRGRLVLFNSGPRPLRVEQAEVRTPGHTESPPAAAKPPSILLVVLDAFRADHMHALGYPRETTPCLDALAREGSLFTHAFAQGPMTIISMASLLTGTYAPQHQARPEVVLSPDLPTLAERLQERGYRTVGVSSNPFVSHTFGLSRGFEEFDELFERVPGAARGVDGAIPAETVTAAALAALPDSSEHPFFLLAHYIQPHAPYAAPRNRWGRCAPPVDSGFDGREKLLGEALASGREAAKALRQAAIDCYDDNILYVDGEICRIRDTLELLDLNEETIIAVTSDHGEQFLDHGGYGHPPAHLFDESVRVPLVLHVPGMPPAEVVEPVALVDLTTTLAELGGARPPADAGRSLLPAGGEPPRGVLAFGAEGRTAGSSWSRMFRTDEHKLIESAGGRTTKLFSLRDDPGEKRNLSSTEPDQVAGMQAELGNRLGTTEPTAQAADADIPEHLRRQLEALGYLN